MDNEQLTRILKRNPKMEKVYRGSFPCDDLPNPSSLIYPAALIVNLDPSFFDGSHWIAIFAYGKGREVIYFDSYAIPPNILINNDFLSYFPRVIRNKRAYQAFNTETCPLYCILFIYFLSIGYSFNYFIRLLENCYNSDLFVKDIINKLIE